MSWVTCRRIQTVEQFRFTLVRLLRSIPVTIHVTICYTGFSQRHVASLWYETALTFACILFVFRIKIVIVVVVVYFILTPSRWNPYFILLTWWMWNSRRGCMACFRAHNNTSRPAIAGNPRCKNITAKSVHLTSLYHMALTSTNDHLSVLRHYVCI